MRADEEAVALTAGPGPYLLVASRGWISHRRRMKQTGSRVPGMGMLLNMVARGLGPACLLAASGVLTGCGALLAEGTTAGAGIGSAALADATGAGLRTTAGIGVQAGARATLQYAQRQAHQVAQNSIAQPADPLPVGSVARWGVRHTVPVEPDKRSEVTVSKAFGADAISCKEVVFSV
jgi:hypothetical protein